MKIKIGPFKIIINEIKTSRGYKARKGEFRCTMTDTRSGNRRTDYTETESGAARRIMMNLDLLTSDTGEFIHL